MFDEVPSLVQLIKSLQQVPCLASKNVYRVATHFLQMDRDRLEQFCAVLLNAKERIRYCPICFSFLSSRVLLAITTFAHSMNVLFLSF